MLSERIEIDDAYLCGELSGGKAERCSENKIPCIVAVQTKNQEIPLYAVFSTVKSFCKEKVELWSKRSPIPASLRVSDRLWCFQAVESASGIPQR